MFIRVEDYKFWKFIMRIKILRERQNKKRLRCLQIWVRFMLNKVNHLNSDILS